MSRASTRYSLALRLALLLALVFSIGLSLWLLSVARQSYAEKLMAQTWPSGRPGPPAFQPDNNAPLLVLLGDSRIVDWGLPELKGFRVANWAVNGSTSAQTVGRAQEMLAHSKPHTVVLQVGINDLKLLGLKPELSEELVAATASNILAIVRDCRRTGARVVLSPVWPTGPVDWRRRIVWSDAVEPARARVNAQLQGAASDQVRVVDLFKASPPAKDTEANWFRDTLHLKPSAYVLLTKRLADELGTSNAPPAHTVGGTP